MAVSSQLQRFANFVAGLLTASAPFTDADSVPLVRNGVTFRVPASQMLTRVAVQINFSYFDLPPTAGNPILMWTAGGALTLPLNMAGSHCSARNAALAEVIFDFAKNGVNFGTMTFLVGGTVALFASPVTSLVGGDLLTLTPRTADPGGLSLISGVLVQSSG